jgi:hypothetical protein
MVIVVGLGTVNVRKRTSNEKRSKITLQHSSSLDNEGNCKGMLLDMKAEEYTRHKRSNLLCFCPCRRPDQWHLKEDAAQFGALCH